MANKSCSDKFSSIETRVEAGMKMARLIARHEARNNIMMNADEIEGELCMELVKALNAYPNLPDNQFRLVLKRMLNNRVSELVYRYYLTHRKAANDDVIFDEGDDDENCDMFVDDDNTDALFDSKARVQQTYAKLSPVGKKVLEVCLLGNDRLDMVMSLVMARAATAKYVRTDVKPWHVADAALLPVEEVVKAFKEIRIVYMEVVNA